jgi:hypothetical protein
MKTRFESVLFHSPGNLQVSVVILGHWKRSLLELLVESSACALGSDPLDASSAFVQWCYQQPKATLESSILFGNLPGCPFQDQESDLWEWYDAVLREVSRWEPVPYLVDLDHFEITHRGETVWSPPPDLADLQRPRHDPRVVVPESPFPVGWYGTSIGGNRRHWGTYACYGPDELPPLNVPFDGTFAWLDTATAKRPMAIAAQLAKSLNELLKSNSPPLPPEFLHFFQNEELWSKIRSRTDCYFHLDTRAVEIPGGLGWLIRFLSDSQSCVVWHLYLSPSGKSGVVSSYFYKGSEYAHLPGGKPHRRDLTMCESSFERFLYRFWLEDEIGYASGKADSLPPGGREYLDFYGTQTKPNAKTP